MNTQLNGTTFTSSTTQQARNTKTQGRIAVRRDARRMRRAIRAI